MKKVLLAAAVSSMFVLLSVAQQVHPIPAPDDLVLQFAVEGNRQQFHLGELIAITYSYTTKSPGKYLFVNQAEHLAGGHFFEISCSPPSDRVEKVPRPPDAVGFEEMIHARCEGVGGGYGSVFSDQSETRLMETPLGFGSLPLNTYVRFRTAGAYTCQASSAQITAASPDEKIRPALLLTSIPITLNITDDPTWGHEAAKEYADAYDKLCRGDNVVHSRFSECSDLAQRITYLDNSDSLAEEVKVFSGKQQLWDNGFWAAIQESSQPSEALRLMTSRMQEPDFQASSIILEWLAISQLKLETPDAFRGPAPEYHSQAVELLRRYVRVLGSSLSMKNADVLPEGVRTYRFFAGQNYCEPGPLIPKEEEDQALAGLSIRR